MSFKAIARDYDDYRGIPRADEFQTDLRMANKNAPIDPLLKNIIQQLVRYGKMDKNSQTKVFAAVAELFQSCNAWISQAHGRSTQTVDLSEDVQVVTRGGNKAKYGLLKLFGLDKKTVVVKEANPRSLATGPHGATQAAVDRAQFQAVLKLFGAVEQKLANLTGSHDRVKLRDDLVRLLGREVNDQSKKHDADVGAEMLTSASERLAHKLFFNGGKIYRYQMDINGGLSELDLLDSADFWDGTERRVPGTQNAVTKKSVFEAALNGFGPFVMSLDRNFYMREHRSGSEGIYHSNYLGGQTAACAGTMLVERGIFKGIRGDSGHYQPTPLQMANALRALASFGISLRGVKVYDWDKNHSSYAPNKVMGKQGITGPANFNQNSSARAANAAYLQAEQNRQQPRGPAAPPTPSGPPATSSRTNPATLNMTEEEYAAYREVNLNNGPVDADQFLRDN